MNGQSLLALVLMDGVLIIEDIEFSGNSRVRQVK